ncbi:hypothetical protein VZT92_021699 [Zoarces viviparus]|uniref:Uncharacterized protein n=1 Tax=Zoarces viviparus TaxID=48416 RepID=A0AAW1EBA2_ZOAVI
MFRLEHKHRAEPEIRTGTCGRAVTSNNSQLQCLQRPSPANPSGVEQQRAGVGEVSASPLHRCHHQHVQPCDGLVNCRPLRTPKDNTRPLESVTCSCSSSPAGSPWEGYTAVVYMFGLVEAGGSGSAPVDGKLARR